MKFYHGTSQYNWNKIQEEGFLFGVRAFAKSRCTYLTTDISEAKQYGEVVLQIEYNPLEHPGMNNYVDGCWQLRVYEPISLTNIRKKGLIMIIDQITETLEKLPKDYALMVIFKLMEDNHITFADIVNEHIDHLEKMRKVENEKMMELQSRVVEMWCGYKKDWRENLKKCIRYLKDLGRINITDEQIDKF